ncbi:hypothetical protein P6709_20220, partial [Jeotgalibacillus sp. ET6]|nr:hypothetical protein [Jeotgalibacillus sp. ET6]
EEWHINPEVRKSREELDKILADDFLASLISFKREKVLYLFTLQQHFCCFFSNLINRLLHSG